jgi:hypothetical protein
MKSHVSIIMALLVIFSAGLAEPLHAAERNSIFSVQLDDSAREQPSLSNTGPGDTEEALGDPDGWLGGQNYRPVTSDPLGTDSMEVEISESPSWTIGKILLWFLMIIGMR